MWEQEIPRSAGRRSAARRQSMDVQYRGTQPRQRETCLGVPNPYRPTIHMIGMPSKFQSWWTEVQWHSSQDAAASPRGTVISLCWTAIAEKACLRRPSPPSTGPRAGGPGWASVFPILRRSGPRWTADCTGRRRLPLTTRSPSFDAQTGLFIVSAQDSYGIYFSKPEHGEYGWAGADYGLFGKGTLRAIDYQTGKIRWTPRLGRWSFGRRCLTTDSG